VCPESESLEIGNKFTSNFDRWIVLVNEVKKKIIIYGFFLGIIPPPLGTPLVILFENYMLSKFKKHYTIRFPLKNSIFIILKVRALFAFQKCMFRDVSYQKT